MIPANALEARERLLDAAQACFTRFGVEKSTIGDIAREAKVTRPTVYKYFEGRDALIHGVLLREATQVIDELLDHLESRSDVEDRIVEGILFVLRTLPQQPHFRDLFKPESAATTTRVLLGGADFHRVVKEGLIVPVIQPALDAGRLRTDLDFDEVTEWGFRIIFSLLMAPSPRAQTEDELRGMLRRLFMPLLLK